MKKRLLILAIMISLILVGCGDKSKESVKETTEPKIDFNGKIDSKLKTIPEVKIKETTEEKNTPKVIIKEGEKQENSYDDEENNDRARHGFIEERIAWGSYEYDMFAVLDEMGEGDLEYFNITESFVVSEEDFFGYVVILPMVDRIHVLAEEVEYDNANTRFKVLNKLWENDINFRESNLIQTPMTEGIPSLRLTITDGDRQIYWFNSYDGDNGSGIHYYSDTNDYTFYEWNLEEYVGDIMDGYDALSQYEEIEYHMEQGMQLHHDGNYVEIDGISCPIFILSTYHEEHIVNEFFYAYDPINEVVYVLDVENDEWNLLGFG